MKCPECGTEMEPGFLGVSSYYLNRPSWFKKKARLGTGGEPLAGSKTNLVYFAGFRCQKCRGLILKY
jgi:hypothetical protein